MSSLTNQFVKRATQENTSQEGPPANQIKRDRLVQLDFLRGIAILLVLGVHFPIAWYASGFFKPLAAFLIRFGWAGVDLFFVLSGFLVGGLLIAELLATEVLDVKRFIVRRALKIWPSFYVFLIVYFIYEILCSAGNPKSIFLALLPNFLHYQNYVNQPIGQTWSLAIEEHFYLALPLMFLLLISITSASRTIRLIPFFMWAAIILCTTCRVVFLWHRPFAYLSHMEPTHLRIDGLCFGVFLAYLYHARASIWNNLRRYRIGIILISFLLILPMLVLNRMRSPFVTTFGYTCLYLGFGGLLVIVVQTTLGEGLLGRFLQSKLAKSIAWIGTFSYPIYLWHILLAASPIRYFLKNDWIPGGQTLCWLLAFGIYLVMAVGTGAIAGTLVERPALLLRDRMFPGRAKAMETTHNAV